MDSIDVDDSRAFSDAGADSMGILSSIFGFSPQPDDVKMLTATRAANLSTGCNCFSRPDDNSPFREVQLHPEQQDTECEAWKFLGRLIETAAAKRSKEFAPGLEMSPEMWSQIITLPRSIAKLTSVKRLYLYSSHLIRIPPEIGAMTGLQELDIYTSYSLHWLPYEVTRCPKLKQSRASTRALYGNYKYRPPFPHLNAESQNSSSMGSNCSVCGRGFSSLPVRQVWISLQVATDVFPLLVNACSEECIRQLPTPAKGYVDKPHTGGLELRQPQRGHMVRGGFISHDELMNQINSKR